jgi:hypothetical protein
MEQKNDLLAEAGRLPEFGLLRLEDIALPWLVQPEAGAERKKLPQLSPRQPRQSSHSQYRALWAGGASLHRQRAVPV